jgi:hypothetical protein
MNRIRWITIGAVLAIFIGAILFEYWNQIAAVIGAVVVLAIFAVAAFMGGGFGLSSDDEDEEDEDDEDDEDDDDGD